MLYMVATPIGDQNEITLRALEVLRTSEHIICESTREASTLLKAHGLGGKQYHLLNEHTEDEELIELLELCKNHQVALMSDCGTPGFCDPGPKLISLCRKNAVSVRSVLGASSLMGLLSLASERFNSFVFVGFLPAENLEREKSLKQLRSEKRAMIFMDTPYRQMKLVKELASVFGERKALLVQNLSQQDENSYEEHFEDRLDKIAQKITQEKAEFMILLYEDAQFSKMNSSK